MAELPVDIIYDILSRIPVKSLGRFRCVCKPWCNYIDDPNLALMHVKQAAEEPTPIMFNTRRPALPNLMYKFGFFRIIESKEGTTTGPEVQKDSDMDFDVKPPLPCKWKRLDSIDIVGVWNKSGDILVTAKRGKHLFVYSQTSGGFHEVNVVGWENGRCTRIIYLYRSSLFLIHGTKKSVSLVSGSNPTPSNSGVIWCSKR